MIPFLKYKKVYYIFSVLLVFATIASLLIFGLKFGIDFLGGGILEVDFEKRPENKQILEKLKELNLGEIVIQPAGEQGVIMRLKEVDEGTHQKILSRLGELSKVVEKRFESIGPAIGRELREKTIILVTVSLLALLIYIAVSFSKVSRPISSWQYGIISIFTLAFDVLIPIGLISLLGKFSNVQFNIPIITALLTILGYTINDKVIIFDRVRENLLKNQGQDFATLVNQSLNQTLTRSLSTGFCTLFALFSIFFFGGETLKYFSLVMIVGIVVGTYSSLFMAAPILVSWLNWRQKRG
jgi:preprotein translocase subunit SecF